MAEVRKLYDETQVAARVRDLAEQIAAIFPTEFTIVSVLTGSFVFVADLIRTLDRLGRAPRVEFIRLRSYGHSRVSSGEIHLVGDIPTSIAQGPVLLVDDIVDTGRTLAFAKSLLLDHGVDRILTCVLIDKPARRQVDIAADLVGFLAEDVFIVGYGIDYAEQYRHLPYIGMID